MVAGYQSLPQTAPPDFMSKLHAVLNQERESATRVSRIRRWAPIGSLALAASLLLAWFLVLPTPKTTGSNPEASLAALRNLQGDDGSWSNSVGTTALATLALLEKANNQNAGADQTRISNALHFLTRERKADGVEELLRCLTLLAEREQSGGEAPPQLELALKNAFRKIESSQNELVVPLLREVVERGHKLNISTREGDAILGRLSLQLGDRVFEKADWKGLSDHLAHNSASNDNSLRLAVANLQGRNVGF